VGHDQKEAEKNSVIILGKIAEYAVKDFDVSSGGDGDLKKKINEFGDDAKSMVAGITEWLDDEKFLDSFEKSMTQVMSSYFASIRDSMNQEQKDQVTKLITDFAEKYG
jgi:phosphate uptake regulator